MAKSQKYYVVWKGRTPGIYTTWEKCKEQISEFPDAQYKSFPTANEANKALSNGFQPNQKLSKNASTGNKTKNNSTTIIKKPAIVVDGAWNTATGDIEYQGILYPTGQKLFHVGPLKDGTNNVAEFLALVHALAFTQQKGIDYPIYSDSKTAIAWVKKRKSNTTLQPSNHNQTVIEYMIRANKWLLSNVWSNEIIKWETEMWGENPADFGRK